MKQKYNNKTNQVVLIITIIVFILTLSCFYMWHESKRPKNSGLWLGVETTEINRVIQQTYDISLSSGLLVTRVFIDSPAEIYGIEKGDILRKWNGISITGHAQFGKLILNSVNPAKVLINRNGANIKLNINLGVRPGINSLG